MIKENRAFSMSYGLIIGRNNTATTANKNRIVRLVRSIYKHLCFTFPHINYLRN